MSYNRPDIVRGGRYARTNPFDDVYPMVRWLEANGYDLSYTTGVDVDRDGVAADAHKAFLSIGHDEYWSAAQRTAVERARDGGTHLAFFTGNGVFWKTRWEPAIDGSGHRPAHAGVVQGDDGRPAHRPGGTGDVDGHVA